MCPFPRLDQSLDHTHTALNRHGWRAIGMTIGLPAIVEAEGQLSCASCDHLIVALYLGRTGGRGRMRRCGHSLQHNATRADPTMAPVASDPRNSAIWEEIHTSSGCMVVQIEYQSLFGLHVVGRVAQEELLHLPSCRTKATGLATETQCRGR